MRFGLRIENFAAWVGLPIYSEENRFSFELAIGLTFSEDDDQYRLTPRLAIIAVELIWLKGLKKA